MAVDWTMAQAKRDFENGLFRAFRIDRTMAGWSVALQGSGKIGEGWLLDARLKQPRNFKTLDASVAALTQIGFQVDSLGYIFGGVGK